ncbi:hypothetical protein LSAT2_027310, partial [Lamellibrachia satsuma]
GRAEVFTNLLRREAERSGGGFCGSLTPAVRRPPRLNREPTTAPSHCVHGQTEAPHVDWVDGTGRVCWEA